MIHLIDYFSKSGHQVIIAGNGDSIELLKKSSINNIHVNIGGPNIKYGKTKALDYLFFIKLPYLLINSYRDKLRLNNLIKCYQPDIVISDNRPFFKNKKVYCIYVTHQLNVFLPGIMTVFNRSFSRINRWQIKKFDECWVPDIVMTPGLSGKLSDISIPNCHRIGILSRFYKHNSKLEDEKKYDFAVILSGPEPQRSIFERIIIRKFENTEFNVLILRGKPADTDTPITSNNIVVFNHLDDRLFVDALMKSKLIICRSGYTTIMDLFALGRTAILIPTPGQPEQEYLADHLTEKFGFVSFSQKEFRKVKPNDLLDIVVPRKQKVLDIQYNKELSIVINKLINKLL